MSELVETYPEVEPIYIKIALKLLPRLHLEDQQIIILAKGLPHLEQLKQHNPMLLSELKDLFDLINPFHYNTIFITKNGGFYPKMDDTKYGCKSTISFGDWSGNRLLIDDEYVSDHNRLVVYDGTKLISETTTHVSGTKYNITFYNIV
jgi:hypothetical protein